MPLYAYKCPECGWSGDRTAPIAMRHHLSCERCSANLRLQVAAPLFKFAGRVTPGGGPDRFTADMLGIPLKELPSELRAEPEKK